MTLPDPSLDVPMVARDLDDPADTIDVRHFVAGTWTGEPSRPRLNPARPGDLVSLSAVTDPALVDKAVTAAVRAQPGWAAVALPERGRILLRAASILEGRAERIAAQLTREEGKTIREATGEVRRAASILQFFGAEGWRIGGHTFPSGTADDLIYTRREPMGVVVAITPWNFPIAIPAWKIAPALIAGNAVILKPAGMTPATAASLVEALDDAGLPPGVLTLLLGPGAEIGDQLVDDNRISAISFTGSLAVGARLYERAAPRRTRVQLEMGGKNALVVLADADPAEAARIAAAGGFGLTGQACTATSRVICDRHVLPAFIDAFEAERQRFTPGDGLDPEVRMGPVVSAEQLAIDQTYLDLAHHEGVGVLSTARAREGLFQPPVILTGVGVGDRLAQEEIFGPIVAVIAVSGLSDAIAAVNASRFGLTAGIVTADLGAAQRFARQVRVGVVKVNQPTSGVELNVPFGGVGDSSTNTFREQGSSAIEFYTWSKTVYVSPPSWSDS